MPSQTTPNHAESGNNWHIERNFIDQEFAEEVCCEISTLTVLARLLPPEIVSDSVSVSGEGLSGYSCMVGLEPLHFPVEASLQDYPDYAARIPKLLELFDLSRGSTGSIAPGFGVNILSPSGYIKRHPDAYNSPASAITLSGVSLTAIEDPLTHEVHVFELGVGDRFVIQNPADGSHAAHEVLNVSDNDRIAFIT